MDYVFDSRFKRTAEQKGKDERGTAIPMKMRVFGDEEGDNHKMVECKVQDLPPFYFPLDDLHKVSRAEGGE